MGSDVALDDLILGRSPFTAFTCHFRSRRAAAKLTLDGSRARSNLSHPMRANTPKQWRGGDRCVAEVCGWQGVREGWVRVGSRQGYLLRHRRKGVWQGDRKGPGKGLSGIILVNESGLIPALRVQVGADPGRRVRVAGSRGCSSTHR
eukprot:scaffold241701_cov30-Tisochrysis_lutea.AAC.4